MVFFVGLMDQSASLIYQVKELHKSVSPEQLEIIPDQYYFIQSYKVIFDTYLVTQSSYSHNETNVFWTVMYFPFTSQTLTTRPGWPHLLNLALS